MFHDLDVCVAPSPEVLQTLVKLGYKTAAFTTVVTSKNTTSPTLPNHASLKLLSRATIILSETSQVPLLSSSNLNTFDIVAVRPTTEKLLQAALNAEIDIISLPLDKRSTYRLRRAHVHVAQSKGVRFEICYGYALRESRRNFFANAAAVARITCGKQLLLSSGAVSHMVSMRIFFSSWLWLTMQELRGVHDVINLASLFDVSIEDARNGVGVGAAEVVDRGDVRARCHKGIVRVSVEEGEEDVMQD